jgi:hypothetical protein
MSRNYKFYNPDGVYFISFAVVEWLDVFTPLPRDCIAWLRSRFKKIS